MDCPNDAELLGVVPSTSVAVQEACVNAITARMIEILSITAEEFRKNHPGGSIGASWND